MRGDYTGIRRSVEGNSGLGYDTAIVHIPEVSRMGESGRWITDENGQRRWQGPPNHAEWRGPARIQYRCDTPVSVWDCLLHDATRGWVVRMLPTKQHPEGEWYRHLTDGSVQPGQLELSAKDARFVDDPERPPRHLRPMRGDGRRTTPSKHQGHLEWDGPRRLLECHGPAVIEFIADRADVVMNCRLPDESRGTVHCDFLLINMFGGWWRRATSDGRWQLGEIIVSDDDVRFIDHELPPTADERGQWIDDADSRAPNLRKVWDGPHSWAEPHGQAVAVHGSQGPRTVFACLLPDGSRGTVTRSMEGEGWQRELPDGSRQNGDIEISGDEVRFIDGPQRSARGLSSPSPAEAPNLATDLMSSARIADLVKERRFAEDLYRALCNIGWFRNGKEWDCTWRSAGGIVADLRDCGEEYIDFYCSGSEGTVTTEVEAELAELGWTWTR
jgi:hypothetical protein